MSKYNNVKAKCLSGHVHDSKLEAGYCNRLLARKQAGEILDYAIQVHFPLVDGAVDLTTMKPVRPVKHVVDFLVQVDHGEFQAHEVKGHPTAAWKIKKKLFMARYPQIPYIVYSGEKRRKACSRKRIKDPVLRRVQVYR
jgi:hypothetical protein